jgi:hypothetical protein
LGVIITFPIALIAWVCEIIQEGWDGFDALFFIEETLRENLVEDFIPGLWSPVE